MIASPVAMVMVVVGCAKVVRRAHLSARVLRAEMVLGRLATVAMVLFLAASGLWMLDRGPGRRGLFTTGAIDRVALLAMVVCLLVAVTSLGRARRLRPTALAN